MRDYKTVLMLFSFYDRSGIEEYLEKQALKGWMLDRVTPLGWRFRREAPKKVHYTVCYFPGASPFDPEPTEAELTFREFCEHSGWEIVISNGQMKVFRNEYPDPVPIETEALLELENIHAAAKKTFLPVYIMDMILGFMQVGLFINRLKISFIGTFSVDLQLYSILWWVFLIVLCGVELLRYFLWRRRALRAAKEDGSFLKTPGTAGMQYAILLTSIVALLFLLLSMGNRMMTVLVLGTVGGIFAVTLLTVSLTALMKRWKFSARLNRGVTYGLVIVLSLVLALGLIFSVVSRISDDMFEDTSMGTYEHKGHTFHIYKDEIPLRIEEFMETDYLEYNYILQRDENSFFLSRLEAMQRPRYDALEQPDFSYTIVDVKWKALYGLCLLDMLDDYDGWQSEDIYGNVFYDSFILADAEPWDAEYAYQLSQGGSGEMSQVYILCYPGRLVQMRFGWDITQQQKEIIGLLLKNIK